MPDVTHQVIVPHSYVTAGADVKSPGSAICRLGRVFMYVRTQMMMAPARLLKLILLAPLALCHVFISAPCR